MSSTIRKTSLPQLRKQIDRVDQELLRWLNERATLALQVGQLKRKRGLPVFDGRREEAVLRQVARANRGPLSPRAVAQIFQVILRESRRLETKRSPRSTVNSPQ